MWTWANGPCHVHDTNTPPASRGAKTECTAMAGSRQTSPASLGKGGLGGSLAPLYADSPKRPVAPSVDAVRDAAIGAAASRRRRASSVASHRRSRTGETTSMTPRLGRPSSESPGSPASSEPAVQRSRRPRSSARAETSSSALPVPALLRVAQPHPQFGRRLSVGDCLSSWRGSRGRRAILAESDPHSDITHERPEVVLDRLGVLPPLSG